MSKVNKRIMAAFVATIMVFTFSSAVLAADVQSRNAGGGHNYFGGGWGPENIHGYVPLFPSPFRP